MTIAGKKFEWSFNLNTVMVAFQLIGMIALGGYYYANTARDIDDLKKWVAEHEKVVEERLIENRTLRGQTEARIKDVEAAAVASDRAQDQLTYRLTVVETSLTTQQEQQQKINDTLSDISGDLKVIKAFVDQQNAARRPGP